MKMPQHPARWILTLLFLALVGLTVWIVWAVGKLEDRREEMRTAKKLPATEQK